MEENVRSRILKAKQEAQRYSDIVNQCRKNGDAFPVDSLKGYIQSKFMLDAEDMQSENILELAKRSLARQYHVAMQDLKYKDGLDCAGASSSMTKKILLIMAIEKDMNVYFTEEESGCMETITDIAEAIQLQWCKEGENV